MNDVVNFPSEKAKIINEACLWLAKLDARELSQPEKVELTKWINQSEDHKRELTRLADIWDNIEAANLRDIPLEIGKGEAIETPLIQEDVCEKPTKKKFRILMSIAASLFVCLSIGMFLHIHELSQFKSTNGKYATDIGEQQTVRLSDGSEIRLNTNTLVEVNYFDGKRNIHLYKGEAHFNVAHDPDKPFTVKARKGEIRALGTIFSVRVKNNRVNVIVEEGTVRIRANENVIQSTKNLLEVPKEAEIKEIKKVMVIATAGKNVVFGEQEIESIIQEEKEAIERKFSWRHGMLAFDDEPLSDVIDEVSRYTSNKIIIADPAIRSLRVGGYYPIGKIQVIFDALELNLGVHIKQVDERTYYITYDGT
ncbi:MAG: FecR domain-containing protein [Emcibacteraceae bacterium]|nr:FecR domain-containing protein [Emcibacteraceae bacterium]